MDIQCAGVMVLMELVFLIKGYVVISVHKYRDFVL